ncbi:hypothetical protein [Flavobacterium lacus]|uniref:GLPGLI family protein n=1 Tax=Flavobacterium lacus TaxID=1353778 RepID=A0A328WUA5_9FLAO|nr:hypothetical protein [Flavobacterium lacus]RAR47434.1 hypothetical protein B0I10_109107 [Flavobacterium lacus]
MKYLLFISIIFFSTFSNKESDYYFDKYIEYENVENNTREYFMFNENSSDYYFSFYFDFNNKLSGVIRDSKNLKSHHFLVSNDDLGMKFTYLESTSYLLKEKNKTFKEYHFESTEKKIDSVTNEVNLLKFNNPKKKKLSKAFDIVYEKNNILIDQRFLNLFCHGYFSNTDFEFSIPLPKKLTVYHNDKKQETYQLTKLQKINTQLKVQ